jgi:hypothetical protein
MNMSSSTEKERAQAKAQDDQDSESVTHESVAHGTILGDDVDDAVLRANGHNSDLKRQFSWISALGLGFSITNSWAGYLVSCKANIASPAIGTDLSNRATSARTSSTEGHRPSFSP